jgi:hypothetical protein
VYFPNPTLQYMQQGVPAVGSSDINFDPAVTAQQMAAEAVAEQVAGGSGRTLEGRARNVRRRAQVASGRAAQQAGPALQAAGTKATEILGKVPKRGVVGGGALLAGVPALMQGDIAGAAGSTVGGLIGGGIGAAIGGPFAPLTAAAGTALGSLVGGGVVGATQAALEKTPQAVSIPTPFGDLPLNASAQQLKYMQQLGELGETQYRNALGTRTSALIDLNKQISDQDYLNRKRDFPLMQAEQNADLARSQALINTQNNAYMQQMVLGTASNMMLDAQRERGALMRQAIATNPYVTALAAPNVSIG